MLPGTLPNEVLTRVVWLRPSILAIRARVVHPWIATRARHSVKNEIDRRFEGKRYVLTRDVPLDHRVQAKGWRDRLMRIVFFGWLLFVALGLAYMLAISLSGR